MSGASSSTTRAVRAALESDSQYGAVIPPIHLTSTFAFKAFGEKRCYDYTRSGNPTRDALGETLAALEGGVGAVVTASGMAAVSLVCSLLNADDLLIAPHDCYGGTYRLLSGLARRGALRVEFVDQTDERALTAALARGRSWSGSRRPAIRCCASSTFGRPLTWLRRPARCCWSTTLSFHPRGSNPLLWALIWSCIRRRST